jgi:hypothetical protein
MPRTSAFYGIAITMYYAEQGVPQDASIAIETVGGSLPDRALRLVREWAMLRRGELEADWRRARDGQPLERIPPLP